MNSKIFYSKDFIVIFDSPLSQAEEKLFFESFYCANKLDTRTYTAKLQDYNAITLKHELGGLFDKGFVFYLSELSDGQVNSRSI